MAGRCAADVADAESAFALHRVRIHLLSGRSNQGSWNESDSAVAAVSKVLNPVRPVLGCGSGGGSESDMSEVGVDHVLVVAGLFLPPGHHRAHRVAPSGDCFCIRPYGSVCDRDRRPVGVGEVESEVTEEEPWASETSRRRHAAIWPCARLRPPHGWSDAWCPPGMFVRPRSPGSWRRCASRPDGFRPRLR